MAELNSELLEVHLWQSCHGCGMSPIEGMRYECQDCPVGPNIDLCADCFELYQNDQLKHPKQSSTRNDASDSSSEKHCFSRKQGKPYPKERLNNWLQHPMPSQGAPVLNDGFVVRPMFTAGSDYVIGSSGFVVEVNAQAIAITALHVMDELVKKRNIDTAADHYSGEELPSIVAEVDLYNIFAETWMLEHLGKSDKMLVLPNARIHEVEPKSNNDIAVFTVTDKGQLNPGTLAKESPLVGEKVWLAFVDEELGGKKLSPAVVVESTEEIFIFRFDTSNTKQSSGGSGSPILNAAGEVVAIHAGEGRFQGVKLGHANNVGSIHRHLKNAMPF